MTDHEKLFFQLRGRFLLASAAGKIGLENFVIPAVSWWPIIALPAPIMLERDDDGPCWQLHPNPDQASVKAWCWIVAVRARFSSIVQSWGFCQTSQHYRNSCQEDPGFAAWCDAVHGHYIEGLVAFSRDLTRCHGAFMRGVTVIGSPQEPEMAFDQPVRIFESLRSWVQGKAAGVLLVGTEWQNQIYLEGCQGGIITDNVAHGERLRKKLKRAYEGPAILVAA